MSSVQKLKLLLLHASLKGDFFLSHLQRLLSTAAGRDSLLCTAYYTLAFTHAQLTRVLARKYEQLAETIARNASKTMLPGETLIAEIQPPHLELTEACLSVKSFGDAIDDVRTFWRLRGLLDIYVGAKSAWNKPSRDPALKLITWAKIFSSAGFQLYENGAYLAKKGVLRSDRFTSKEARWWTVSSQFWLAEVVLEFVRLARVRQLQYNEEFGAEKVDEGVVSVQSKELERKWWTQLYANMGWFPNAVHWGIYDGSVEESPMSETMVGLTGFVPGFINLKAAWKATARA
ncbi:putative peroxisomal biogenesis factor 11 [Septoria linicola]|nr:putative peroxisomal biogenesis factor 11 [Septoria linicola]